MELNILKIESTDFIFILGITYLDHAGSALFPESLLKAFTDDLRNNVYGKCKTAFPLVFSSFHLNRSRLCLLNCWKSISAGFLTYRVVGRPVILQRSHSPFVSPLALFFGGQGHVCLGSKGA